MNTDFVAVFNVHIRGHWARKCYWKSYNPNPVIGNNDYYGFVTEFEHGWKTCCFGGGCSGNDCNTIWIIDSDDKVVVEYDNED